VADELTAVVRRKRRQSSKSGLLGRPDRKNAHYLRGPHESVAPPTVFLDGPCQSFSLCSNNNERLRQQGLI
jgi:hypothetical protein